MALASMFPGGNSQGIKLDAVTEFTANSRSLEIRLNWTDPDNKYLDPDGTELATWDHTRIIRKAGSQPVSPYDGVLVVESAVKNQYQTEPYWDSGLENEVTYYYAAYAFTTDGLMSDPAYASATPKTYAPILNDNTWEEIKRAYEEGIAETLWQKGDTKDEIIGGNKYTFELLAYNPSIELSDGTGKAGMLFATKNLGYSLSKFGAFREIAPNNYLYTESYYFTDSHSPKYDCVLKATIDTLYNGMSEELKALIPSVKRQYIGVTDYNDNVATMVSGNSFAFPFALDDVDMYYPTNESRTKSLNNGEGRAFAWRLGDATIITYRNMFGDTAKSLATPYIKDNGVIFEEYDKREDLLPEISADLGVCFAFCLGTQPEA